MIKVAINGYGTIGKRVADAVSVQKDMRVIGVSKTSLNAEAYVARERGYPLYLADLAKKPAFDKVGIPIAGDITEMLREADIVVDATPGGVGAKNKGMYEQRGIKAIFQGGEDHEVAGFSFCSDCNYTQALGRQFTRVVSCNTTGLCRIINTIDKAFGIRKVHAVMVRRGADPAEIKKGPVDAIVLDPVTVPSHHGPDVQTVLPHINITTMATIVPTTFMHVHAIKMDLKRAASRDEVLDRFRSHSRIGLISKGTAIRSTAELKEYVQDMGRPRADMWENGIFEASVTTNGDELLLFQAIHQESVVVVENVDAIRAMAGAIKDPATSIKMTNEALQFSAIG
ncbi:MAG: type II glyceraldehyde-3-phosphate dehydrogenase [Methanomicrobiales archaeon]|nr:type II glyceraldehyde-3-phosphate dehydrogenase [Methanomicrobiales archaeon]